MDTKNESSTVMLSSNIMLRTKYERDPWSYIPADLLPSYYSDTRVAQFLSAEQRKQMEKKLFYASHVIDEK